MITSANTIAIIQARMSSSRLPGKVLLDIGGQPMLGRVVERTRRAGRVQRVVVATTTSPDDDPIAKFCSERGYYCFRGSLHDVLERYYQAASQFEAEIIVRVTADCPVIDPSLIDQTVDAFMGKQVTGEGRIVVRELSSLTPNSLSATYNPQFTYHNSPFPYDFAANRLPPPWGRTFPIGLDTEVCSFQALETAWQKATQPHQREHVMPYLYDNRQRFRILLVDYIEDHGAQRWTVDTPEDLEVLRRVYAYFGDHDDFSWLDVLKLFQHHPELAQINAQVRHKTYNEVDNRRGRKVKGEGNM
jgi:spore coat polysaccharide biosynthesis protein SpsF